MERISCVFSYFVLGVTITELVLSELLLYSIIGIAQVAVIMTVMFVIFEVSCVYAYKTPNLAYISKGSNGRQCCFGWFYLLAHIIIR